MKVIIFVSILIFINSESYPYTCKQEERGAVCTQEFKGVCGLFNQSIQCIKAPCGRTFGTICQACSDESVATVTEGTCEDVKDNTTTVSYCSNDSRGKMCTQEYIGVCAWYDSSVKCSEPPCIKTMGNVCSACSDSKVEKVTNGECPKEMKELIKLPGSGSYVKSTIIYLLILILI